MALVSSILTLKCFPCAFFLLCSLAITNLFLSIVGSGGGVVVVVALTVSRLVMLNGNGSELADSRAPSSTLP